MAKLGGLLDFAGRTARAVDQGYDLDNVMYHASKQDIKKFKPGYDDGLVFLTPNKEFANNWLGKGKFQERQDGTGAIEGVRAEIKQLRKEADEIMESLPDDQASQYYREVFDPKRSQLLREEQLSDSAIYPVVTKTKKPFVPSKDVDVLEELYGKEYLEAPFGSGFATFRDAMKDGNYLLYENKQVVDFLKSKGYDSMFLKESSGEAQPFTTLAVFEPSDIRSVNAQFDPNSKDSSQILSSAAPITAGLLGAGALGSSDEAQAGPTGLLGRLGRAALRDGENLADATERARLAYENAPNDKKLQDEYLDLRRARDDAGDQPTGLLNEIDVSYRGSHQPRGPDSDYPVRLDNLTETVTGESGGYPQDFYSLDGPRLYAPGPRFADDEYGLANKQSYIAALKARGNPDAEVTIYRAVPNDKKIKDINPGDFVTLSPKYAELHAAEGYGPSGNDKGKVISQKVKVKDIYFGGDDVNEYGYFPSNPAGNSAKSPLPTTLGAGLLGTASVPSIQDKAKATGEVARQAIGGLLSPIAAAPHVLIQALTSDMPTDQIDQNYQRLINQPRFQPKTQLGQQYSQQAQQALATALRGPLAAASAVAEPIQNATEKLHPRAQIVGRSILDLLP